MNLSERGVANIFVVCTVVFGLGLASSAYLNFFQAQRSADEKRLLKGQITDLAYQLGQDRKSATSPSPSPAVSDSPSPSANPSPTPSSSPSVLGAKTLALTELGVSLTLSEPVTDLIYANQPKNGVATVGLTTTSLQTKYPKCVASFLGQISKRAAGVKANNNEHLIKSIGGNSYYYIQPVVECATDADGKALRAKLVNSVSTTIISSLN
jgi:hypothetical protein